MPENSSANPNTIYQNWANVQKFIDGISQCASRGDFESEDFAANLSCLDTALAVMNNHHYAINEAFRQSE